MRRDVELKEGKCWSVRTNSAITIIDQRSDFRKGFGLGVILTFSFWPFLILTILILTNKW